MHMRTNQHTFFSVRYEFSEVEFMRCKLLMDFGDAMRDAMDVTRKPVRCVTNIIKLYNIVYIESTSSLMDKYYINYC